MTTPHTLDAPGASCAFQSHTCTAAMVGHGGLDQHHRWPKSLGGPEHPGDLLVLCPNHHARAHSLVRYLVETAEGDQDPKVLAHFTHAERLVGQYAVVQWQAAGSQAIAGWSRPAAR